MEKEAHFPQLERLQRTREEIWDQYHRYDPNPRSRQRMVRRVDLEALPVDEVFRRINAGEYLE